MRNVFVCLAACCQPGNASSHILNPLEPTTPLVIGILSTFPHGLTRLTRIRRYNAHVQRRNADVKCAHDKRPVFRLDAWLLDDSISPSVKQIVQPRLVAAELEPQVGVLLKHHVQRLNNAGVDKRVYMAYASTPPKHDPVLALISVVTLEQDILSILWIGVVAKLYVLCAKRLRVALLVPRASRPVGKPEA